MYILIWSKCPFTVCLYFLNCWSVYNYMDMKHFQIYYLWHYCHFRIELAFLCTLCIVNIYCTWSTIPCTIQKILFYKRKFWFQLNRELDAVLNSELSAINRITSCWLEVLLQIWNVYMHSRISVVINRKSITDSATSVYFEVLAISSEHPAHKSGDMYPFMLLSYIQL